MVRRADQAYSSTMASLTNGVNGLFYLRQVHKKATFMLYKLKVAFLIIF